MGGGWSWGVVKCSSVQALSLFNNFIHQPEIWWCDVQWYNLPWSRLVDYYIDGLVQDCSNSIANALELLQSCTKPLILFSYSMSLSFDRSGSFWTLKWIKNQCVGIYLVNQHPVFCYLFDESLSSVSLCSWWTSAQYFAVINQSALKCFATWLNQSTLRCFAILCNQSTLKCFAIWFNQSSPSVCCLVWSINTHCFAVKFDKSTPMQCFAAWFNKSTAMQCFAVWFNESIPSVLLFCCLISESTQEYFAVYLLNQHH